MTVYERRNASLTIKYWLEKHHMMQGEWVIATIIANVQPATNCINQLKKAYLSEQQEQIGQDNVQLLVFPYKPQPDAQQEHLWNPECNAHS